MSDGAKKALTHSSIYALGNIARQLAGFIMLPIYTRHLSPADYGVVGLLMAALALIEVFFGARLSQSIPKFYFAESDPSRKKTVVSTALVITASASLVTVLMLINFREDSSKLLFGSSNYSDIIGLFSVLILTQALEFYAMTFIRIQQRPWLFISISLLKLAFQLVLNVWLVVYEDIGVMGIALASAGSSAIFGFILAIYTINQTGLLFCRHLALQMLKFNWPLWLGGFAGLYMGSANRYFINLFSSTSDVGLFELAVKFSMILGLLVWDPFNQYWSTERFKIYHTPNAVVVYKNAFLIISTILAIGTLGIALFSDPIIRIMAAPAFHSASLAVPFLALSAMFSCLTLFSNFSFLIKEKTFWITRNSYLTAAILTLLFFVLIPHYGFVGAALASLIASSVQFLLVHRSSAHVYDMGLNLKPLVPQVLVIGFIVLATKTFSIEHLFLDIAAKCGFFATGTGFIVWSALRSSPATRQKWIGYYNAWLSKLYRRAN